MVPLVAVVVALVDPGVLRARLRFRPDVPVSASRVPCPRSPMVTARRLRHQQRRAQHGRQRPDPRADRGLGRADLLDVRRRAPADRRPDAGRLRDARVAVPVRRHDRLRDRAPAGVPRRRAPARARDAGRRGAPGARSTTSSARTATTRSRATTCAARAACGELKERCYSCGKPIDPAWKLCPYCEAETGARPAAPPRAAGRRRGGDVRREQDASSRAAEAAAVDAAAPTPTREDPPWTGP